MAEMELSRRAAVLALVLGAGLLSGAGCKTGTDDQVQQLRARATYEQGLNHLSEKRVSLGLSAVQEAVRLDPESALYRNTLGVIFLHYLGKPAEAHAEFQKALAIDPSYAEAQTNLGIALSEQGKWDEAVAAYRKALSMPIYPTPEIAYANLGWAYLNQGKLKEAEEAYRTAVQLQPKFAQAYYFLGVVLERRGQRAEARAAFKAARDLDPESPLGKKAEDLLKTLGEGS
jgi:Tfp pilus assembly protein PilF